MSPRNVAASVRQRLLNKARAEGRPFAELLQYYVMERFLYRLARSSHADRLILKGALMLRVWDAPMSRPTMDIDMLGKTKNDRTVVEAMISDILQTSPEEDDGLEFDASSLRIEKIREDADYEGWRVRVDAFLGTARATLQIDIGFGDVVHPRVERMEFPALLDEHGPEILGYTRESTIAEKVEAMVRLGSINSRMKDFYDVWLLSRRFDFDGKILGEAIRKTFERRGTPLVARMEVFDESFVNLKRGQWVAFLRRLGLQDELPSFETVTRGLDEFLTPVLERLTAGELPSMRWIAPGPWQKGSGDE